MILTTLIALLTKFGMEKIDAGKWARRVLVALVAFVGLLVLFGVVFVFRYCERKKIEKTQEEAANAQNEVIKTESETNQAINNLINANQKTQEVNKNKETNVSFDEANRNRCKAFPDAKGC